MYNLARPYHLLIQRRLWQGRLELFIVTFCALLSVLMLWLHTERSQPLLPPLAPPSQTPVTHPLAIHMTLWQLIQTSHSEELLFTRLEFNGAHWELELTSSDHDTFHRWLAAARQSASFQRWQLTTLQQQHDHIQARVDIYP